ncbi:MAG TPA: hypothetical protein VLJ19_16630 [Variovorax sp.]|nr:hypothetical protein [Variovorax sp.]
MATELLHALLAFAVLLIPLGIQWFLLTYATRRQRRRARCNVGSSKRHEKTARRRFLIFAAAHPDQTAD